ncbi:MAG: 16S rRNA (cytosine(1402)-N(4))-methyltransferase RsmH, partial [Gammaproteobacteria bacterium]|nr:16S rRNA (cytosine(1402)-N(4))-methyltransferase RsmH [Gammaproteobacteria bacterium]
MKKTDAHQPVLLDEVLEALNIQASGTYFDGTFGRGGHAGEILKRLGPSGKLLAMDKDPDAIRCANEKFADDKRFTIVQGSFAMMADVINGAGLTGQVNGVFLDLGVSSPQLDNAERGFSFMKQGPLDMRMDTSQGPSAAEWLAQAEEEDISIAIRDFGE